MRRLLAIGVAVLVVAAATWLVVRRPSAPTDRNAAPSAKAPSGAIRLSGTVEATRSRTVFVPRLAGQTAPTLVITHLIRAGSRVEAGDPLVDFDPQDQLRAAADRRADVIDLDGQIQKKRSEQAIAQARDQTAVTEADRDVSRAKLKILANDLISKVEAEKNTLALEQANARLDQLRKTSALRRTSEAADIRILEIQRARAQRALTYAEGNARLMSVKAPFPGLVVLKQVWKGNNMAEVGEGEEVRPGLPILDIVDASSMQVRAQVNQADVGSIAAGLPAKVRLDAYPELLFDGKIELVAPLGVASSMTPKVHTFVALISIQGTSPQLMPDLSASVEVSAPLMTKNVPGIR
ncbi:MAG: HlyD family secretion protein [Vicinamibacterales bacterium]